MSSTAPRRVVITGLGAVTPVGDDVPSTWQAVLAGTPGAATMTHDWVTDYDLPTTFAAEVKLDLATVLTRPEQKRLDPNAQLAMVAAREAWKDAGAPEVEPERLAVAVASGIGGVWTLLTAYDTLKERGHRRVLPLTVPMLMGNGAAAALGLEFGARAGAHAPVSACASGAEGMAQAIQMIRAGRADVVVAGGTESCVHPLPMAGFSAMRALSTRNDTPETASRPYDSTRDGFVFGEGAGIMVFEAEEHALARGAKIYGVAAGYGLSSDGYHITAPDPQGLGVVRAMRDAIADAGAEVGDIVHVNAHATSTPVGDVAEANAIRTALGARTDEVLVSATKSMTGHLLGAAGALEALLTLKAVQTRTAPPTINIDSFDPEIPLNVVRKDPADLPAGQIVALNNSFGFGGHNVVLAFTPA